MTNHDWGERQERADYLLKILHKDPDRIAKFPLDHRQYTYAEVADHIERGTVVGREVMAVAGIVLQAMSATPEFFKGR
jgi:hypothetical protein